MRELNHSYEMQTTFEPMTLYKKDWNENRLTKFIKNVNIEHMSLLCVCVSYVKSKFLSVIGVKPLLQHIVLPSEECWCCTFNSCFKWMVQVVDILFSTPNLNYLHKHFGCRLHSLHTELTFSQFFLNKKMKRNCIRN